MTRQQMFLALAVLYFLFGSYSPSFSGERENRSLGSLQEVVPLESELLSSDRNHYSDRNPAKSSPPDTFVLADYTFDDGGLPDLQGWQSIDLTADSGPYFHVDDFTCCYLNYSPIAGSQSLWCGLDSADSFYETLPGYGNNWSQTFESVEFSVNGDVDFSFWAIYDCEMGYDYIFVQYMGLSGTWITLEEFTGYSLSAELYSYSVQAASHAGTIRFRFSFISDSEYSDEDGGYDSIGALIIDNIAIMDSIGSIDSQEFETEGSGDTETVDGNWQAGNGGGFGDYAGLVAGTIALQKDPCISNESYFWSFYNGSTTDFTCGGYPLHPTVPNGDGTYAIDNAIWSPWIDVRVEMGGDPIPSTAEGWLLAFDVYVDLPLNALVGYEWEIQTAVDVGGTLELGEWGGDNGFYFGDEALWSRKKIEISRYIGPGTTHMRVALICTDACPYWGGIFGDCSCHTPAPFFDNVSVMRIDTPGPLWSVRDMDLFQDSFSADGTVTGTVRIDMALDIELPENPIVQPGDSLVVTVYDTYPSLGEDPVYGGPAVYLHVKDVSPEKSGSIISGDLARWPVTDSGGGWTTVRFDNVITSYGSIVNEKYCVDLNDNLYTPGDTIVFYCSARDYFGSYSYWSLHTGTVGLESDVRLSPMEMTCLPANALNGATDILYVDDCNPYGPSEDYDAVFVALGLTPDRYDVRSPGSSVGNGPGTRITNVAAQLQPYYDKIIWSTGYRSEGLLGDGEAVKSDDLSLLFQLLDTGPDQPGLCILGDHVAADWDRRLGISATQLKSYINHSLFSDSHRNAGLPESPQLFGVDGSMLSHVTGSDVMAMDGGCPLLGDFDVLTPAVPAFSVARYDDNTGSDAVLAQETINTLGETARVVLGGFDLNRLASNGDRVHFLRDILLWLDHEIDLTPVLGLPTNPYSLAQNSPNPFNPQTMIAFDMPKKETVRLAVYDVSGRLVDVLIDNEVAVQGRNEVVWRGRDMAGRVVSAGVYFYRLKAGKYSETKRMTLVK